MVKSQQPSMILKSRFFVDSPCMRLIVLYFQLCTLSTFKPKGVQKKRTFLVTKVCMFFAYKMVKTKKNDNLPENNAIGMFLL
jgi:hypothetical protein